MDYAGYVFGGYGAVLGSLGLYAWFVVRRGRAAARQLPAERRRWTDS